MVGKLFKSHDLFIGRCFWDSLFNHFGRYGEFPIEARLLDTHPEAFRDVGEFDLVGSGVLKNLVCDNSALFELTMNHLIGILNF